MNPRPPRKPAPHHLTRVRQLDAPHHFHEALTDEERLNMERAAFNFFNYRGERMKVPPTLFEDLRSSGVDMQYFDADEALAGFTPPGVGG